ncbi:MAG: hypothetical protein GF383_02310 [Candidatus Lokiarchaeota archaeon]|nr:hypothetical protein [Candidatus Lokiarchaeota archaeon]MBD3338242.1 hypothetical protein [Candidatus Lokiarchaeota archaeon]
MKTEDKIQKNKFGEIQEPEDFYIISDNDDLVLTSKEAVELLIEELESVEYDAELADFYSKFDNEIDDPTNE